LIKSVAEYTLTKIIEESKFFALWKF